MTNGELTALLFAVIGIWGATINVKTFFNNKKEIRLNEIEKEKEKERLRSFEIISAEQTKRTELLTELLTKRT